VALAAIVVDAFLVAGLVVPVVVNSGSMAPGLCGPHRRWTCGTCRREFRCGLESLPSARHPAVCPYCFADNDASAGIDYPGDRVLVDRTAFFWRNPQRWDVVVLRCADHPAALCVKRVVGLPIERVELRAGDVWIDGHLAPKTGALVRDMGVLVDAVALHWHDATGHWRKQGDTLVHPGNADESQRERIDWLTWCRPARTGAGDAECGAIFDESPYDQSESRTLNPVHDVQVRAALTCSTEGEILLRAHTHGDAFLVQLDSSTWRGPLEHNQRVVAHVHPDFKPAGGRLELEWTLADGRMRLALDGRQVLEYIYDPTPAADRETAPLLAIGARRAEVAIGKLEVWRDIYYTAGRADPPTAGYHMGLDEYFLLGDNSPHSEDSRAWPRAGIPASRLVGRILRW
jgi:signal peptidase I